MSGKSRETVGRWGQDSLLPAALMTPKNANSLVLSVFGALNNGIFSF